ncbi:MAG TPA: hypothetical protein VGN48_07605 [Pedococcus sp.]|nr:hypothetical protein [Pedococcus sp.]
MARPRIPGKPLVLAKLAGLLVVAGVLASCVALPYVAGMGCWPGGSPASS